MYNLAVLHAQGTGVKRDNQKAHHWLEEAAAAGDGNARNLLPRLPK